MDKALLELAASAKNMDRALLEFAESTQRAIAFAMFVDFIFWVVLIFFVFQAGRWYERGLSKKQRNDDDWTPKEPTL